MNRSTSSVFPRRLQALFLAVALTSVTMACGSDPKKDPVDAAAADAVTDGSVASDTGSSTTDTGTTSADTGSATTDAGPVAKTSCGAALLCQTACGKGDTKCVAACAANVAADDKATLGALETCAVDLCKDVTEGTAAEQECAYSKCYDKYKLCAAFGGGTANCTTTVGCLASCALTDFTCRLTCMKNAEQGAVATSKATADCAATKCKGITDQVKLGLCVATSCATEVGACLDGAGFGCLEINLWIAKCVKSSTLEPNYCVGIVKGLADTAGRAAYDAYETCKTQCLQAVNVVGCWGEKCSVEANTCFGKSGTENCQDIDKCAIASCGGVGGDTECLKKCLPASKAASQDAYLLYEGCMVRNMATKEAETAKCTFPFDQAKCIPIIKGQFCGNESQNCFTDQ